MFIEGLLPFQTAKSNIFLYTTWGANWRKKLMFWTFKVTNYDETKAPIWISPLKFQKHESSLCSVHFTLHENIFVFSNNERDQPLPKLGTAIVCFLLNCVNESLHNTQDSCTVMKIHFFPLLHWMLEQYIGLPVCVFHRHCSDWFCLVMTMHQEVSCSGRCAALSVECKCWKLSCEHIAFSIMWRFLGCSQELSFLPSSFTGSSLLQAHDYAQLVFEDLADKQPGHMLL